MTIPRIRSESRLNTLRGQFTLVIFLLAFLPSAILTLVAGQRLGLPDLLGLVRPLLVVALLSAALGWLLSGALLGPLTRLERELERGMAGPALAGDPQEVRSLRLAFAALLMGLRTEQQRRGAFMATLVHDLKTPLIATGHLVRTISGGLPEEERRALAGHLLTENARLLGLVQQMADAHRFEREDVQVSLSTVHLRPLLERVVARSVQQAGARELTVSAELPDGVLALADPAVLERAVGNLTDNALRYARSRVRLTVSMDGGVLTGVQVRDDGPGLSVGSTLEALAQPFNAQPFEIAGQHYTAGTAGLGLYIVRRIAEAHGGALVYRREEGETVFELLLRAPPGESAARPAPDPASASWPGSSSSSPPAPDPSDPAPPLKLLRALALTPPLPLSPLPLSPLEVSP